MQRALICIAYLASRGHIKGYAGGAAPDSLRACPGYLHESNQSIGSQLPQPADRMVARTGAHVALAIPRENDPRWKYGARVSACFACGVRH